MTARSFLAAFAVLAACAPEEPASTATYYHGMRLVSGDGSPAIDHGAIVVDEGKIVAMGAAADVEAPSGAEEVDLSGYTVIPLLHSVHVHLGYLRDGAMAAENYSRESVLEDLNLHAHYGIGSVLVVGSDTGETAFALREEQSQGKVGGARLFTAGRGITSKGGWPTQIPAMKDVPQQVGTEEEAREAVRKLGEQKADAVKIWVDDGGGTIPKISPELYRAVIDEARKLGLPVVAHVFYHEDARLLVEAGVSGLVHSIRDREVDDALVAAMKERDVFYVPTLTAHQSAIAYAESPEWIGEAAMRETVPASVIDSLKSEEFMEAQKNSPTLPQAREQYAIALANVKKLDTAGVRIGLGTDSGTPNRFPGYFEHREVELFVEAGLSPEEAIAAATGTSAAILGLEGRLAPGADASFLVLRRDPLSDIRATRDIEAVYRRGEKLERRGAS